MTAPVVFFTGAPLAQAAQIWSAGTAVGRASGAPVLSPPFRGVTVAHWRSGDLSLASKKTTTGALAQTGTLALHDFRKCEKKNGPGVLKHSTGPDQRRTSPMTKHIRQICIESNVAFVTPWRSAK